MVNLASLTARELAEHKRKQADAKRNKAAKKKNKNKIKKKPIKMDRESVEKRRMLKLDVQRALKNKKNVKGRGDGTTMGGPNMFNKLEKQAVILSRTIKKNNKSSTRKELEKLNAEANKLFNEKNSKVIKISVDNSGIPESKAILKAFNKLKKLLNKK
tara:strand:+ start:447 stop:920 length:474 start_codon:yes stop_codon:yes gene_type:complete